MYFKLFKGYYTTGPLNAWIWLAEEHSEMCNYFHIFIIGSAYKYYVK